MVAVCAAEGKRDLALSPFTVSNIQALQITCQVSLALIPDIMMFFEFSARVMPWSLLK